MILDFELMNIREIIYYAVIYIIVFLMASFFEVT